MTGGETLRVESTDGGRVPWRSGDSTGWRYAPLTTELEEAVAGWLETGAVTAAEEIKPGRVWLHGELLVKLYPERTSLRDRFRPSTAVRVADLHARLPIRTARPILAAERRQDHGFRGSILVTEFIEGAFLGDLWGRDEGAVQALPIFMARTHAIGLFHGDFHLHNLIWSGEEWVLIDLESLRHPLRLLFPRRLVIDQWARIYYSLNRDPRVRSLFETYLAERALRWDSEAVWRRVEARERVMDAVRDGAGRQPLGQPE